MDAEAAAELKLPPQPDNPPSPPVASLAPPPDGYLPWRASTSWTSAKTAIRRSTCGCSSGTSRARRCADWLRSSVASATAPCACQSTRTYSCRGSMRARSRPSTSRSARSTLPSGIHTARDVTSCPGAESCNLAVTASRAIATAIAERLDLPDVASCAALQAPWSRNQRLPELVRTAPRGRHRLAWWREDHQRHHVPHVPASPWWWRGRARRKVWAAGGEGRCEEGARCRGRAPQAVRGRAARRRDTRRVLSARGPEARGSCLGGRVAAAPRPGEDKDIGEEAGFQVAVGQGECAA